MLNGLKGYINRELVITFLSLGIGMLFLRFVTDDYSAFSFGCAAKQFSDFHYFEYFWQGLIGYSEVYRFLYGISDTYNWIMISWICFGFLGLYLSLSFIRNVVFGKHVGFVMVLLAEILFSLLYLENFYSLSHTRFSLMFCGLGLVNLAFREKLRKREIFAFSLLFIAGMLMRPEGALGMLLLVGGAKLIYSFDVLFLMRRFWLPSLGFLVMLGAIVYDWHTTDDFVKKLEPEVEYNYMERRTLGLADMTTAQDSVKHQLATRGMWFDPKELSPEYLRSLIKPESNFSTERLFEVAQHISQLYLKYIAFPVLMLVLVLILVLLHKRKSAFRLVLFILFSFLLLYAVDYKGLLLSGRHFLGFQLTTLLIALFYFFSEQAKFDGVVKRLVAVMSVPVFAAFTYTLYWYKRENREVWLATCDMEKAMQYIESRYVGHMVVVSNEARYCFDRHPTLKNQIYTKNTYILFDHGTYSMVPRYSDYMKRLTGYGVESPEKLVRWFSDQDALYMSNHERYGLIQSYFGEIYGMQVVFADSVNINQAAGGGNFMTQDYEIRSIKVKPPEN